MTSQTKPFECPFCGFCFTKLEDRNGHAITEHKDKVFVYWNKNSWIYWKPKGRDSK